MIYALNVQSEAVIDIQTAFEWYELQKGGLGYKFIEEVENGFLIPGSSQTTGGCKDLERLPASEVIQDLTTFYLTS